MRTLLLTAVAAVALGGCGGVPTDTAGLAPRAASPTEPRTDAQPSEQDKAWIWAIHEGNLAEMQMGQLGRGKGSTPRIKKIGKMIVADHTELDAKVTKTAGKLGIKLPTSPSADQRAEIVRLKEATRRGFDQEFIAVMTNEHMEAIAATKAEVAQGSSPEVVALAKGALPALEKHLSALRQAQGGSPAPPEPSPGPETPQSPMTPTGHE
ncbi:DUF4142 domain-containing protein [Nonomuraea sp. NPDC049400]|uniref:DUF4142 domain-containing protein n=1 Tax=Nonomuraea sp. NPDC049400 TaxID=3364352 RepID=UPI0037977041